MLDDEEGAAPCARCRRMTPAATMRLWTVRERVRTLARADGPGPPRDERPGSAPVPGAPVAVRPPPAFRASTVTRADAVCPACHARLARGASLDGPERRRVWLTLVVFLAIAAALTWGVPAFMPNLVAAFWRNGAGGR